MNTNGTHGIAMTPTSETASLSRMSQKVGPKSLRFFITFGDLALGTSPKSILKYFHGLKMLKYYVLGEHRPLSTETNQKTHWHMFISFSNKISLSRAKMDKLGVFKSIHFQPANSVEGSRNYILAADDHDRHEQWEGSILEEYGSIDDAKCDFPLIKEQFERECRFNPGLQKQTTKIISFFNSDFDIEFKSVHQFVVQNNILMRDICKLKDNKWRPVIIIDRCVNKYNVEELLKYHFRWIVLPSQFWRGDGFDIVDDLYRVEDGPDDVTTLRNYKFEKVDPAND